jgi:hypothetical protein
MKWETLYCPNRSCHHYGRPFGQGLLVKNGTSHGKWYQPERQGKRGRYPAPRRRPPPNRRLTRKTTAFSKELPWMEKQLWLSLAYYHFCLPHLGLREELPTPEPTRGNGSPRRWRPVTPAIAVGMTDHVWTTAELLGYRVPASFLDTLDVIQQLFPALDDDAHHVS